MRDLRARMEAAGGGVVAGQSCDEADLVCFRCTDPDGYLIEVYWE